MKQFVITPAAGKRLIGKAAVKHPSVQKALRTGTVVVVAGTTNGYVAEELLGSIGQTDDFDRRRFFRGITLPPNQPKTETGRLPDESRFSGDVVIVKGKWQAGKTIYDAADDLEEDDVILKGANAVDLSRQRAAILIGHPKGGTAAAALQAVIGRRVQLIIPVGLEKRVNGDLDASAALLNRPGEQGPRLWPVPGAIITELQAIEMLTGATARLVAAGGVSGAEGSVWLAVDGTSEQEKAAERLMEGIIGEPPFTL
jgi:hypothetical protein